ncbi:MAG TPA: hypothetical protein VFF35_09750, partial [Bacteroidia bacterium]|nr:hypothetical protein [Bacteroidia bacterium]
NALGTNSVKHKFDIEKVISQDFRTDILQENYFVIESFAQLKNSVKDIEKEILRKGKTEPRK